MKTLVQRTVLRRDTRGNPLPVFIFADEAQFCLIPQQDMMVSTVARESRLIQVHIFQNLPMLYASLGGSERARQEVDGWLSCHHTKIALANTCVTTGQYFSALTGQAGRTCGARTSPPAARPTASPPRCTASSRAAAGRSAVTPVPPRRAAGLVRQAAPSVSPRAVGRRLRVPGRHGFTPKPAGRGSWRAFPYLAPGPLPKPKPKALAYTPATRIRTTLPPQLEAPSSR